MTTRHREVAEMRANSFAAAFLLPATGIEEFLANRSIPRNQVDAEQVVHLMYHFRVSYRATLWRLFNLSWITVDQRRQLEAISPSALARVLGYGDHELGATEQEPDRFRGVAIEAWRANRLSLADLARHLHLPEQEVKIALMSAERAERLSCVRHGSWLSQTGSSIRELRPDGLIAVVSGCHLCLRRRSRLPRYREPTAQPR